MRTLFLIRHAKSSWDSPGLRDFNRPLNERGLRDAPKMAQILVGQKVVPDLLVSSPAKRAITTAQFFAAAFGIPGESIDQRPEIYEAAPRDILKVIAGLPDPAHTVLLFGHNPTFTDVANHFSDELIYNIPTCGIVRIDSGAATWREMYEGNSSVKACFFPKEVL